MKTKIIVLLWLVGLVGFGTSNAGFRDGNRIYTGLKVWNSGPDYWANADYHNYVEACAAVGYTQAVVDCFAGICFELHESILTNQVIDVAYNFLQKHPESRHIQANFLLVVAFAEAWPVSDMSPWASYYLGICRSLCGIPEEPKEGD